MELTANHHMMATTLLLVL